MFDVYEYDCIITPYTFCHYLNLFRSKFTKLISYDFPEFIFCENDILGRVFKINTSSNIRKDIFS